MEKVELMRVKRELGLLLLEAKAWREKQQAQYDLKNIRERMDRVARGKST